jgi:serine protease
MPRIGRLFLVLACACACGAALAADAGAAPTPAAAAEYNPVRRIPLAIGPEAHRLIVGFRSTPSNAVTKMVTIRRQQRSFNVTQAQTTPATAAALALRTGLRVMATRQITPSMHVLFLPKTLYGADVTAALAKLRADPAVEFAAVDGHRYALGGSVTPVTPDDPLFKPTPGVAAGQWYLLAPNPSAVVEGVSTQDLSAIDAVDAWGITTGSAGVVIADVDTGVNFDHPDLLRAGIGKGHLLPGYDFVGQDYNPNSPYNGLGSYLIANDGDGWDPDPSDPGDWISSTDTANVLFKGDTVSPSSWHGTRVVGIFGALSDNGVGVTGISWGSWILPVRALGKGGGYDSDIIAGIEWAAGLSVTNPDGSAVADNPYPADIINLSIGGSTDACNSANGMPYDTALTQVTGLGVLVVIAAGNESGGVDLPGNCAGTIPGVMAVAGLRNVGTKVGYSSFGSEISIGAPAGNCINSSGTCLRSIDTTVNLGSTTPGANGYTNETDFNVGTSFATPIVSGVAALMRAANGNLTPAQLSARMQAAATPFPPNTALLAVCPNTDPTSSECSCVQGQCGAGMVNAFSAVTAALNPIGVIKASSNTQFDASGSVAACNLSIASYAWTASPGIIIQGASNSAQVSVMSTGAGTLKLKVTDNAGHADASATVSFNANGVATVNAPSSAGTAATACPMPLNVMPAPPAVAQSFSPASVGENVASTLTITFSNTNGFALTQSAFTETAPAGLTIQTSPAPTTTCAGASGTLTSSAGKVTMAGANIPASGSCTVTLSVKGATAGSYTNMIPAQALSTAPAGSNTASASTSLTITAPPGKSGGGGLDWWDMMFVAGVLLAGRRQLRGRAAR